MQTDEVIEQMREEIAAEGSDQYQTVDDNSDSDIDNNNIDNLNNNGASTRTKSSVPTIDGAGR